MVRLVSILLMLVLFPVSCYAQVIEEVITIPSRPGVQQSYLLSHEDMVNPSYIAVLFSGGLGYVGLQKKGYKYHLNFLVRSRGIFIDENIATAIVDCPSDQGGGMENRFRKSKEHVKDLAAVVDDLKARYPEVKIYFIGTSRGSISAAYTGQVLQSKLNGIVLTSSVYGEGLAGWPWRQNISIPVLLVHHYSDGCPVSPYSEALSLSRSKHFPLITVSGGKLAGSSPCEPFSPHGYYGKEQETVDAIKAWMLGQPFNTEI